VRSEAIKPRPVTLGAGRFDNNKLHLFIGYLAYIDFLDPGTGEVPAWPPTPRVR